MQSKYQHSSGLFLQIITALMIMLFAYTGLSKLMAPTAFYNQLHRMPLVNLYAGWLSWLIPVAELAVAFGLLFKFTRLVAYYVFTLMMIAFTIFIWALLSHDQPLPCSCGGVIQQLSWRQHLVFNLIFILIAIVAIFLYKKNDNI